METLDVVWFTLPDGTLIGVVLGEDQYTKKRKAYIGIGTGADEEADIKKIMEHGAPLAKQPLQRILDRLGK